MFWFIVAQIFSFVLDVVALRAQSDRKKDLEIRLVRQQLCIVERKQVQQCRLFTSLAVADANGLPYYGDDNELPEGWQYTSDESGKGNIVRVGHYSSRIQSIKDTTVLGGLYNPNGINAPVVYVQHPISPVVTDFSPKSWKALEDVYASFGRVRNFLNGCVEFDIDTSIELIQGY